jgi:hypothetical protein
VIHVGVTASRNGLTGEQVKQAHALLQLWAGPPPLPPITLPKATLHHGDCVNGDEALVGLARPLGYLIHGHPPANPVLRAWVDSDITDAVLPYLVRNRAIVDASRYLIACPGSAIPNRSGTWRTVRYAREQKAAGVELGLFVIGPKGEAIS